jgi:hypothetical protein
MCKVIDFKTRKVIKSHTEQEVVDAWHEYANEYIGQNSCAIYWDADKNTLSFIAPTDNVLLNLIVGSFELLKAGGVIQYEGGKTSGGIFHQLRNKLFNVFTANKVEKK